MRSIQLRHFVMGYAHEGPGKVNSDIPKSKRERESAAIHTVPKEIGHPFLGYINLLPGD